MQIDSVRARSGEDLRRPGRNSDVGLFFSEALVPPCFGLAEVAFRQREHGLHSLEHDLGVFSHHGLLSRSNPSIRSLCRLIRRWCEAIWYSSASIVRSVASKTLSMGNLYRCSLP